MKSLLYPANIELRFYSSVILDKYNSVHVRRWMSPPLRTVITVWAPLLRIPLFFGHQVSVSGPLFFTGVSSSLGNYTEWITSHPLRCERLSLFAAHFFLNCRLTTPWEQPGTYSGSLRGSCSSEQEKQGELSWLLDGASSLLISNPGKPF